MICSAAHAVEVEPRSARRVGGVPALHLLQQRRERGARFGQRQRVGALRHDRHPERVHLPRHREVLQFVAIRRLRARPGRAHGNGKVFHDVDPCLVPLLNARRRRRP
jgi:hypothetical protein